MFHAPNGSPVAVDIGGSDGQVIVRPAPPGYLGHAQIETSAGSVIVNETVCEVLHMLERKCGADK